VQNALLTRDTKSISVRVVVVSRFIVRLVFFEELVNECHISDQARGNRF